jgi:hypothetical protein
MKIDRRGFSKIAAVMGVASLAELSSGWACSLSSVYNAILQYVPVGLSAVASILAILTGGGVVIAPAVSLAVSLVNAGFADLKAAVNSYESAPAANKATLLGKVSTVLASVEANLQAFWSNLSIPDQKLESTVQGLLGVVVTTLLGFGTQLPAPAATPAIAARASLRRTINLPPQKRSVAAFKKDFNAILEQNGLSEHKL